MKLNSPAGAEYIIIDDLLPCDLHGKPLCTVSCEQLLWVPLLQKAMAKLLGSYEVVWGCKLPVVRGLRILNDCWATAMSLKSGSSSEHMGSESVWSRVRRLHDNDWQCIVSAAMDKGGVRMPCVVTHQYQLPQTANREATTLLRVVANSETSTAAEMWTGKYSEKWLSRPENQELQQQLDCIVVSRCFAYLAVPSRTHSLQLHCT